MNTAVIYGFTLGTSLLLDAIWLGIVARRFYNVRLGRYLRAQPNYFAAALFFLVYAAGIVHFIILPAETGDWRTVALNGAFFGMIAYGTYNTTNQATIEDWPWSVTVVDLGWGMVVTPASATAGLLLPPMLLG